MPDLTAAFPPHCEAKATADGEHLLSRPEVAERLRVSRRTVRRLGAAGMLEEIRVGERAVRITEASVERHLAERRINRTGQGAVRAEAVTVVVSSACVALLLLAGLFTAYESADEIRRRQARNYEAEQKADADPRSLTDEDIPNLSGTTISRLMEAGALGHLGLGGRRSRR